MPASDTNTRRALILVAIPVEFQAVSTYLTDTHEEMHPDTGTIYTRGKHSTAGQTWDVLLGETGMGNVRAALEVERALNYYQPRICLFIGIAGGLKDVTLGDIVVASQVHSYESGKAGETYQARSEMNTPKYHLLQCAKAVARRNTWHQRLITPHSESPPRVWVEPIVTGENVISSTSSPIYQFIRAYFDRCVAAEMEGHGFSQACYSHPQVDALCIRGISDLIDNKKQTDAQDWQSIAADHASAFAFELLAYLDTGLASNQDTAPPLASTTLPPAVENTPATPGSDASSPDYIQQFHHSMRHYHTDLHTFLDLFGEDRPTFPDQCHRALRLLKELNAFLKNEYQTISPLNRQMKWQINKVHEHIDALQSDLAVLLGYNSPSPESRSAANAQKKVRKKFEDLLNKLGPLRNPQ